MQTKEEDMCMKNIHEIVMDIRLIRLLPTGESSVAWFLGGIGIWSSRETIEVCQSVVAWPPEIRKKVKRCIFIPKRWCKFCWLKTCNCFESHTMNSDGLHYTQDWIYCALVLSFCYHFLDTSFASKLASSLLPGTDPFF